MRRLRLTEQTERVVAEWAETSPDRKRRAAEFLRSLLDGTWVDRWWWQPTSASPEVVEIRFEECSPAFMTIFADEDDGMHEYGDVFTIVVPDAVPRDQP